MNRYDDKGIKRREFLYATGLAGLSVAASLMSPLEVMAAGGTKQVKAIDGLSLRSDPARSHIISNDYLELTDYMNKGIVIYNDSRLNSIVRYTDASCNLVGAAFNAYELAKKAETVEARKDYLLASLYALDWSINAHRQFLRTEVRSCGSDPFGLAIRKVKNRQKKQLLVQKYLDLYASISKDLSKMKVSLPVDVPMDIKDVPSLVVRPNYLVQNEDRSGMKKLE